MSRSQGQPIPGYVPEGHQSCPPHVPPPHFPAVLHPPTGFQDQIGLKVAAPLPAPPLGPRWLSGWFSAGGRTRKCSEGQGPDAPWGARVVPRF